MEKVKMKKIYGIRTRLDDDQPWSDPVYYLTKKTRDKIGSMNRVLAGIRTHSFEEKVTETEAYEKCQP